MRIVDNYNYLPGCCWICRGVAKPIIDMEQDLDGHTTPEDANPSGITRLYICADCAIEIGRMMAPHRNLEINKVGELSLFKNVADELAEQIDLLEDKLESIASAIHGVESASTEEVDFTEDLSDGEVAEPDTTESVTGTPSRKRALPRRREQRGVNVDFLGKSNL